MVSGIDCLLHHLVPIDNASVSLVVIKKGGTPGLLIWPLRFGGETGLRES
jgi:hypothetical protein